MLDQTKVYKERMTKVLSEAIEVNNTQLVNGSAEDYANYKYLVGVGQTLAYMKDRLHTEYNKLYQEIAGGTDD